MCYASYNVIYITTVLFLVSIFIYENIKKIMPRNNNILLYNSNKVHHHGSYKSLETVDFYTLFYIGII